MQPVASPCATKQPARTPPTAQLGHKQCTDNVRSGPSPSPRRPPNRSRPPEKHQPKDSALHNVFAQSVKKRPLTPYQWYPAQLRWEEVKPTRRPSRLEELPTLVKGTNIHTWHKRRRRTRPLHLYVRKYTNIYIYRCTYIYIHICVTNLKGHANHELLTTQACKRPLCGNCE